MIVGSWVSSKVALVLSLSIWLETRPERSLESQVMHFSDLYGWERPSFPVWLCMAQPSSSCDKQGGLVPAGEVAYARRQPPAPLSEQQIMGMASPGQA